MDAVRDAVLSQIREKAQITFHAHETCASFQN